VLAGLRITQVSEDEIFQRDWLHLKVSRLDNSHDAEMRKLLRVDLLILDLSRPRSYPDDRHHPAKVRQPRNYDIGIIAAIS
jgi:hypothetical protein